MSRSLHTPRLSLRELRRDDLDFVAEMVGDARVMRFYPQCYSRDEASGWLQRQLERYASHGHGLWLVSERETGLPVGQVGLLQQCVEGESRSEIGYLLHHPYWRRGYAAEAATAVRDRAFFELGRTELISLIRPENLPSQAAARRLGMQPGRHTLHAGLDHIIFGIRRPDPARRPQR